MFNKFKQSTKLTKISAIGLFISILGMADSIYLTIAHLTNPNILVCPTTSFINCDKVTTSQYSTLFHVPIVYLGLLFFISMFILELPHFWKLKSGLIFYGRLAMSVIGMIMVFYLVYAELDLINAICLFCTGVHILTFGLFINNTIGSALLSKGQSTEDQKTID